MVKESARLGIGTSGHLPRIAPDETLVFHDKMRGKVWKILPKNPHQHDPIPDFDRVTEEGDRRRGNVGVLRIYETPVQEFQMASDYFIAVPYKGFTVIRAVLETL